ncbi:hypothetical protein FN846DRAFT_244493 [Sphaerosporella brunnea]|uniref:Uncharacterized protein n=1 Tax=Sphaerosporella brunnea TaxID=1250544 RepID=A0A5J5FBD5_9PEZI|nr:hypothetical protein FN846DRAFT_244493 [Sphaerosporella brunnea]
MRSFALMLYIAHEHNENRYRMKDLVELEDVTTYTRVTPTFGARPKYRHKHRVVRAQIHHPRIRESRFQARDYRTHAVSCDRSLGQWVVINCHFYTPRDVPLLELRAPVIIASTSLLLWLLLLLPQLTLAGEFGETYPHSFGDVNMCVPPRDHSSIPIPPAAFATMVQTYRARFGARKVFREPEELGACCNGFCLKLLRIAPLERDVESPFLVSAQMLEDAVTQLAACVHLASEGSVALYERNYEGRVVLSFGRDTGGGGLERC